MLATLLCVCASFTPAQNGEMPWVAVAKDKKSFILEPSGKPFMPWGFNYDHDTEGRLIEDYWDKVEVQFGQMKKPGANVVRMESCPMMHRSITLALIVVLGAIFSGTTSAQDKPVVGLIPKAQKPIAFDGKLTGWDDAFVTPVHVGHPSPFYRQQPHVLS